MNHFSTGEPLNTQQYQQYDKKVQKYIQIQLQVYNFQR